MIEKCIKKSGGFEFECIHWKADGHNYDEVLEFIGNKASYEPTGQLLSVTTLGGVEKIFMGGYRILRDKLKNFYIVKDAIFEKNFNLVVESAPAVENEGSPACALSHADRPEDVSLETDVEKSPACATADRFERFKPRKK